MKTQNNEQETMLTPGTKIKCIKLMSKGDQEAARTFGYSVPHKGKTYTVRGIVYSSGSKINMVLLNEIKNPDLYEGYEFGYFISDFEIVSSKKRSRPPVGSRAENSPCPSSSIN